MTDYDIRGFIRGSYLSMKEEESRVASRSELQWQSQHCLNRNTVTATLRPMEEQTLMVTANSVCLPNSKCIFNQLPAVSPRAKDCAVSCICIVQRSPLALMLLLEFGSFSFLLLGSTSSTTGDKTLLVQNLYTQRNNAMLYYLQIWCHLSTDSFYV